MAGNICIHKLLIASMLTIPLHHFHQMFEDSYSIASHTQKEAERKQKQKQKLNKVQIGNVLVDCLAVQSADDGHSPAK